MIRSGAKTHSQTLFSAKLRTKKSNKSEFLPKMRERIVWKVARKSRQRMNKKSGLALWKSCMSMYTILTVVLKLRRSPF